MAAAGFARALLAWYDREKRDLPWRRQPTAYRTLVSEAMCQQTVIATVVPYFQRFVALWPDCASLAAASIDDVLAAWSGLGYYRRARHLHAAAVAVMEHHDGVVPLDEDVLRALPGVGEYTAAAVAAIAGGRRTFALDGNAARVVARLFAVTDPIDVPAVRARLRAHGQTLVPRARSGDFAQAVMELGARVCVPARPRCDACPVARACQARAVGRTHDIPARLPKRAKKKLLLLCVAVEREGALLLVRQPEQGLLASTWSLPAVERSEDESAAAAVDRALAGTGVRARGRRTSLGHVRHVFTHRDADAEVVRVGFAGSLSAAQPTRVRWIAPSDEATLPLSSFARRLIACAREEMPRERVVVTSDARRSSDPRRASGASRRA